MTIGMIAKDNRDDDDAINIDEDNKRAERRDDGKKGSSSGGGGAIDNRGWSFGDIKARRRQLYHRRRTTMSRAGAPDECARNLRWW